MGFNNNNVTTVLSKVVIILLIVQCLLLLPLYVKTLCWVRLCVLVLVVFFNWAFILLRNR